MVGEAAQYTKEVLQQTANEYGFWIDALQIAEELSLPEACHSIARLGSVENERFTKYIKIEITLPQFHQRYNPGNATISFTGQTSYNLGDSIG